MIFHRYLHFQGKCELRRAIGSSKPHGLSEDGNLGPSNARSRDGSPHQDCQVVPVQSAFGLHWTGPHCLDHEKPRNV